VVSAARGMRQLNVDVVCLGRSDFFFEKPFFGFEQGGQRGSSVLIQHILAKTKNIQDYMLISTESMRVPRTCPPLLVSHHMIGGFPHIRQVSIRTW